MSSLRLAMKQSLQETGHLAADRKRKKGAHSARRRRKRREEVEDDDSDDDNNEDHNNSSGEDNNHGSENEFDSEAESEDSDNDEEDDDDDQEEEEEDDDDDADPGSKDGDEDVENDETSRKGRRRTGSPATAKRRKQRQRPKSGDQDAAESKEDSMDDAKDFAMLRDQKRIRKMERKMKKLKNSAANKIQSQWKKTKEGKSTSKASDTNDADDAASGNAQGASAKPVSATDADPSSASSKAVPDNASNASASKASASTPSKRKKKDKPDQQGGSSSGSTGKTKTVPPPSREFLDWARSLSERRCRKYVGSGLRVKVRFATKVRRDGKLFTKKKWYGGRVSAVSKEGSKIRIKYDDGTSEVSKFPDKDVVVDDTENGRHIIVSGEKFIPPQQRADYGGEAQETQSEEFSVPNEASAEAKMEASEASDNGRKKVKSGQAAAAMKESKSSEDTKVASTVRDGDSADNTKHSDAGMAEDQPKDGNIEQQSSRHGTNSSDHADAPFDSMTVDATEPGESMSAKKQSPHTAESHAKSPKKSGGNPATPKGKAKEQGETSSEVQSLEPDQSSAAEQDTPDKKPEVQRKPSLTIRIPNIKMSEKELLKSDDEDEGSDASEPGMLPEGDIDTSDSIAVKKQSTSRKRNANAMENGSEATVSKKRIHIKRISPSLQKSFEMSAAGGGKLSSSGEANADHLGVAAAVETQSEQTFDEISGEFQEHGAIPADMEAKHRAHDPMAKKLNLSVKRRSPHQRMATRSPAQSDSPTPISDKPSPDVSKPLSKSKSQGTTIFDDAAPNESSAKQKRKEGVHRSSNSAFDNRRNKKAPESENPDRRVANASDATNVKVKKRNSLGGPSTARTGRRAAQEAKEKLTGKEPPQLDALKKRKKRKKEGGADDNESEVSDNDPHWVQCDRCAKWRILPSIVDISALPNKWYCEMNTFDQKRNNCAAPEQTPKQIAKERKRAKKRRKRIEEAAAMDGAEQPNRPSDGRQPDAVGLEALSPASGKTQSAREPKVKVRRTPPASEKAEADQKELSENAPGSGVEKEKKKKKIRPQEIGESLAPPENEVRVKGKPGRKRGRPARQDSKDPSDKDGVASAGSGQDKKEDADNVEWVQCEKCNKWRKLPPEIAADDLPDTWYCTMNTWNPNSSSCESPEDKADALHQDIHSSGQIATPAAGKFSYRSLIFGTGKKHNRPTSERTRAAESIFARPIDDRENPYPVVMYSKSSSFLPRTSNFTKKEAIEDKPPGIFDIMAKKKLWDSFRGPDFMMSSESSLLKKEHYYDAISRDDKELLKQIVMYGLGMSTLTGDEVLAECKFRQWADVPENWLQLRSSCNEDIIVNVLLDLVREGVLEMTCNREMDRPVSSWVPRYRLSRRRRYEAIKESRCMKIAKPWKQRADAESQWVSGETAHG